MVFIDSHLNINIMKRRNFLKYSACAGMSSQTILTTLVDLCKASAITSSSTTGYKALVCVLLNGGNDSFNTLIPRGTSEYAEYATTRSDLAIPQADILPINPITPIGKDMGVHPNMPQVQQLFENGNLAFISNVGTLIEPILDNVDYGNKARPQKLGSHSDQREQWMTSFPQESSSLGWGGRTAEILSSLNSNANISMNISLEGKNIFQASNALLEYSIANDGNGAKLIDEVDSYSNGGFLTLLRNGGVDSMVEESYLNVFEQTIANITGSSLEASALFGSAIAAVPPFATTFSDNNLSEDLSMVAKTIAARTTLNMNRQIFFVSLGGFDNHNNFGRHSELMTEVSTALGEFYAVLQEMGVENEVTTFTISDFSRTLTSNGSGSDHAWGGNAMVMGGAVKGREIYGSYPDLYIDNNPLMTNSRGRFIPTTSCDEYFAELVSWFGVSDGDIPYILPNIGNFYSVGSTTPPIGFLL